MFEATAAGCATAKRIFAFTRFGATLVGAVATGLVEWSVLLSFLTNSFNFSGLFLSSSFDTFTGSFGLVASVTWLSTFEDVGCGCEFSIFVDSWGVVGFVWISLVDGFVVTSLFVLFGAFFSSKITDVSSVAVLSVEGLTFSFSMFWGLVSVVAVTLFCCCWVLDVVDSSLASGCESVFVSFLIGFVESFSVVELFSASDTTSLLSLVVASSCFAFSVLVFSAALASWFPRPKINVVPTKIDAVPTVYFLIENLFKRFEIIPFFVIAFLLSLLII